MLKHRSCPVCQATDRKVLWKPKASPGTVSQCLHCGMIYIGIINDDHALIFDGPVTNGNTNPHLLTSSSLQDIESCWEYSFLPDKEAEWPALRQNAIDALQHIERHITRDSSQQCLLDFGSGWGFFLAVAQEQGWLTYGLEPLIASAIYARATFGLNVITDTLHENSFPPDFFDVITSFQVFEHLPSPQEDIRLLHRTLKQGGIILIEVPNIDTWTLHMMRSRHRHFTQDHLNFFSLHTLGRFLTTNKFRVIDYYYPTRRLSVRHLCKRWLGHYLPASIVSTLEANLKHTQLWTKTININIGDIIAVIARKE